MKTGKLGAAMLLIIGMTTSQHASADFAWELVKQETCGAVESVALDSYNARIHALAKDLPMKKYVYDSMPMRKVVLFAIDYGYDKAVDARDARMAAWAYCIDNGENDLRAPNVNEGQNKTDEDLRDRGR